MIKFRFFILLILLINTWSKQSAGGIVNTVQNALDVLKTVPNDDCPVDKDGHKGEMKNNTCCFNNLEYDKELNIYLLDNYQGCGGCPIDKADQKGEPGKDQVGCCSNGRKYNIISGYYSLADSNCGCPTNKKGEIGTPGQDPFGHLCCTGPLLWNNENQYYDTLAPKICGCPEGGEKKDDTCCKGNKALICSPAYDIPDKDAVCEYAAALPECGCPEDGEAKNDVCCKDGELWSCTIDPSWGNISHCGYNERHPLCGTCPKDEWGNEGKIVKTENFGDVCCLGDKIWDKLSFTYTENALCGCPDKGKAEKDEQTCCKNNFAWNPDTEKYDLFDKKACGCPEGGEEKNGSCCKNNKEWSSEKKQYSLVTTDCCPEGEVETSGHCCPSGYIWLDAPN